MLFKKKKKELDIDYLSKLPVKWKYGGNFISELLSSDVAFPH